MERVTGSACEVTALRGSEWRATSAAAFRDRLGEWASVCSLAMIGSDEECGRARTSAPNHCSPSPCPEAGLTLGSGFSSERGRGRAERTEQREPGAVRKCPHHIPDLSGLPISVLEKVPDLDDLND